jgi:cytochrome c oxidase subunit 2
MHAHGMQRMTRDGDSGAHVLRRDCFDRRTARIGASGGAFVGIAHRGATPHRAFPFLALASLSFLTGCDSRPLSALDAAGPTSAPIVTLWWAMCVGAAALLALVMSLLWFAYRRPGYAATASTNVWLLGGGVLMPATILIVLASYAFFLGERLIPRADSQAVQIEAVATMWRWEFRYPQFNGAPPTDELHIPADQPVDVIVTSGDVIHSFWIPRLAGKIDAIPGHVTKVRLQADTPGEYAGQCAEFCGLGHAHMQFKVIAHSADGYRAAISGSAP